MSCNDIYFNEPAISNMEISSQPNQYLSGANKQKKVFPLFINPNLLNTYQLILIMSQFDHSQLLQLIHYKDFAAIFEQWPRLVSIFGQERTLDVGKQILENNNAKEVLQLSDQQIRLNFNGLTDRAKNPVQKPDINPEKSPVKKQIQKNDEKTILRESLLQYLKFYREFTQLGKKDIEEVISITFEYLAKVQLIPKKEIISKIKGIKGKSYHSKQTLIEYLRIVDSSLYYTSNNHRLRSTQIISLILFLYKNTTERVLLQILTGEGKSTVVSCLAAILTISGKRVDIVTTSQLLAKRDVQEKAKFYELMGLRVCHNFQENQKGPKSCYEGHNIIYGTPHSFQVDILFDEYKKKQTRCKRPFEAIIVDEVDSMFVDQKGHQTLLATTYPGFSEFIYPMKVIWNKINSYPIFQQDDKTMMVIPIGKDQTITGQARQVMNQVIKDIRQQFKNEIITEWRMDFINQSLDNWIRSAITAAFVYKEKEHYFVKNKDIAPIDLKNTGVIQQNVHWQNGLHQFLQIKHGLTVTTEGMTSNFISNLAHFDRYKHLYGLTGTLGSSQSKKFLVETFNVQLMKVPPFKQRKLQIDDGMILYNETEWARYIVDQIGNMIACERSVLLICESIHEVELIKIALQNKVPPKSIQFLTTGEEQMRDIIDCKELIVATNLAGRGTDLKITQKLNERGGLHVIIGFMPSNLRVEMQGRGRAGRNGCEGSSELAVNYTRYCQEIGMEIQPREIFSYSALSETRQIMDLRDKIQAEQMKKDKETVEKLRCKDRMFTIYCKGMDSIPDFEKNYAKQLALEEQWAMFLKKVENRNLDMKQALKEAQVLVKGLARNSQAYYNPNHQIARGTKELCDNKDGKNYQRAIPHFQASTKNTSSTARIIGGIMLNACKLNQNPQNADNIKDCLKGFAENKREIKNKIEMLKGMNGYDNVNKCFVVHHEAQQINRKEQFRNKLKIQNGGPVPIFNNHIQPINIDNDVASQIQIESGQQRILNALCNQIQKIQELIKGLGKNEFVKIKLEPIKEILESLNGDKMQNEKAMEKFIADGLRFEIVGEKYKKKIPWWKRVVVFALGVLQVVCGAIILAATSGVLTGFAVGMMVQGATQCFDAIFRPELLDDLGRYYGKVALSYMFSLAMSGTQGIKELGTLSQKGFTLFKNMPFKEFMATTFSNAWQGMKMFPGALMSIKGSMGLISPGVRNMISAKDNSQVEQIGNPIRKIQAKKQSYKKQIDDMLKQESLQDTDISLVKERFDKDLTKIIQGLLLDLDKNLLAEARIVQMTNDQVYDIISDNIKKELALSSSSPSQSESIKQLFKKNLKDPKLAQKFADHIKLKELMKNALEKIRTSDNYSHLVKLRTQQMIHKGLEKQESYRRNSLISRSTQLENERNYLQNNKGNITPNQYNKKVEAYNSSHNSYNEEVAKFNKFIQSQFNKPPEQLYNKLKDKKAFTKDGRVDLSIANTLPLHEYTKSGLAKIQYINSMPSFEKALENAAYNEVVNYGQLIINALHSCQSQIAKKVKEVAKKFNE